MRLTHSALGVAAVVIAVSGCGGAAAKPIKIRFRVGETKTYDASQLPAHSTLICRVDRREGNRIVHYVNTLDVPARSVWDTMSHGWVESSVAGDTYFGMKSEEHGKRLRVSCARSPGGLP